MRRIRMRGTPAGTGGAAPCMSRTFRTSAGAHAPLFRMGTRSIEHAERGSYVGATAYTW